MNSISKIALGVALGGLAAAYFGPVKLVIAGLLVAGASYAYSRWVAPLI